MSKVNKNSKTRQFLFITSAIACALIAYSYNRYQAKQTAVSQDQKLAIDNQTKTIEQKIRVLSQEYGLFFFFSKDCPACKELAPVVKKFCDKYGWDVIAISESGEKHELFKRSEADKGLAEKWEVNEYPSLFAVNPKKELVTKISQRAISLEELEKRITEMLE